MTPESTKKLLRDLRAGNPVKIGPQNHRKNSEGPLGRTSLKSPPPTYTVQDFTKAKKDWEEKRAAAAAAAAAAKQKK